MNDEKPAFIEEILEYPAQTLPLCFKFRHQPRHIIRRSDAPVRLPHFLRYSVSVCRFVPDRGTAPVTFPAVEGLPERIDVVLAPKIELAARLAAIRDMPAEALWQARATMCASMLAAFLFAPFSARAQTADPMPAPAIQQTETKVSGMGQVRAGTAKDETVLIDLNLARSEEVRRIWPFLRDRRIDAYGDLTKRFR